MECAPSKDSNQPGHPPSLIRDFAVRMKKTWVLSYPLSAQRRLWSDWADAHAGLSLFWAHNHFVGFVMMRHRCPCSPRVLLYKHEKMLGLNKLYGNFQRYTGNCFIIRYCYVQKTFYLSDRFMVILWLHCHGSSIQKYCQLKILW